MWNNYSNPYYGIPNYGNTTVPQQPQQNYGTPNYNQQMSPVLLEFVQNEDAAKNYPISPNGRVILMDMNNCFLYSKIADAFGKTDMRKFKFTEIPVGTQLNEDIPKITSEDVKHICERLDHLEDLIKAKEQHDG